MAGRSHEGEPHLPYADDALYDADGLAGAFEARALLHVCFDEGCDV
jgi:hypothetical protein